MFAHSQGTGGVFSPVCVRQYALKCELLVNLFPHSLHLWGFSPVWILQCIKSLELWLKLFQCSPVMRPFSCVDSGVLGG